MAGGHEATESAAGPSSSVSLTGNETLEDSYHSSFQCCVCLDLLYKPVVLACGHMSCFWCVHKAMHGLRASHCAICRQPYIHFPSICLLLHHLLMKMEPAAYKRREREVLEEERQLDIFSPELESLSFENASDSSYSDASRNVANSFMNHEDSGQSGSKLSFASKDEVPKHISITDVLCAMCKELLCQPTVLNCGHVFCESCLTRINVETPRCHVCQSLHPGEFPNICLGLDHFVEEHFPNEYACRRDRVQQLEKIKLQCGGTLPGISSVKQNTKSSKYLKDGHLWLDEGLSKVHVGVGCDSCGMYPIVGKRYKCKDCKEAIGFDLCESCYSTSSKLPGRFNQQHTADHQFQLDDSHMLCKILLLRTQSMEDPYQDPSEGYASVDDPDQNGAVTGTGDENINDSDNKDNLNN